MIKIQNISNNINELIKNAELFYQQAQYEQALRIYYKALIQLPKPHIKQEAAGAVLAAIGNTYFQLKRYEPAIEALRSALQAPSMVHNPLILLRLGQSLFDHDRIDQGRTYLQRAYRLGGTDLFRAENDRYISAIDDLVA